MAANIPESEPDKAWEALLRQLRDQPLPEPRPFFYARVRARLEAAQPRPAAFAAGWLQRPAYAALLGLLVLGLNIGAAIRYSRWVGRAEEPSARPYTAFVTEYQLDPFTLPVSHD